MTAHLATGTGAAAQAALTALKALPNSGLLIIADTAAPADPDGTIPTGIHALATFTFSSTAFGANGAPAGTFPNKTVTATASFALGTVTASQTGAAASFYITNAAGTTC